MLLQRARASLDATDEPAHEAGEPPATRLLETYIRAFETPDVHLLQCTLHHEAVLEMAPARTWFSGRATCLPYLTTVIGEPGEWSARATSANAQPAAVVYRHGHPFAVVVLGLRDESIARISLFGDPGVIERFVHPQDGEVHRRAPPPLRLVTRDC